MEPAIASPTASAPSATPAAAVTGARAARRLILALLAFGLPYAALLGFPAFHLHRSGELADVDAVMRAQADGSRNAILGLAYTNPDKHYKRAGTALRSPEFLVLGASRIMQIRHEFFKPDARFYNAGGGVEKIRHLRAFLGGIPEGSQPKHLLLGMEQFFFNPEWDNLANDGVEAQYKDKPGAWQTLMGAWPDFYRDLSQGKFSLARIGDPAALPGHVGINALMNGNGFRNDGSYRAGAHLSDPDNPAHADHGFRSTLGLIAAGKERWLPAAAPSGPAMAELRAFLAECRRRNVHVTGFLPGFAPTVWARLNQEKDRYGYLFALDAALRPVFEEAGFAFKDFSDIAPLGATDAEFFDGYHGSEKVMLRILIALREDDPTLEAYLDAEAMGALLDGAQARRYAVIEPGP